MTRAHLVMAAGNCLRNGNSSLGRWGIALRERIGGGKARVAIARKLAVLLLAMWKSGREYESQPHMDRPSRASSGGEAGWETEAEQRTETILLGHLAQPAASATREDGIPIV